jgi:dihydropteroate synthase
LTILNGQSSIVILLTSAMRQPFLWSLPRASIELGPRTAIMGILNVTPDSFSDAGLYFDRDKAVARGKTLEQEGADILDIGGESTRPGGRAISETEEIQRVLPVIESLASTIHIPISVDTYRSAVARRAIEAGAQIVNDVSGFRFDPELPQLVRASRAGVVLMHSRGARDDLHRQPASTDPVQTVMEGLDASVQVARYAGVNDGAIVVDPGIGFSKDAAASLAVLKNLNVFSTLRYPLLVGTSRKSFIRTVIPDGSEARLMGTAATVAAAVFAGAHIVRVHDVRPIRAVTDMLDRIASA